MWPPAGLKELVAFDCWFAVTAVCKNFFVTFVVLPALVVVGINTSDTTG